jgi:hypothetical protein
MTFAFGLVQGFLQDGLVKLVKVDVDRSHDLIVSLCVCNKNYKLSGKQRDRQTEDRGQRETDRQKTEDRERQTEKQIEDRETRNRETKGDADRRID